MKEEMQFFRNSWDDFLAEAFLIAEAMDVPTGFPVSHKRKRKRFADESQRSEEEENQQTESNLFRNSVFYVALDNIISALDTRFQSIANICEEFAAILKIKDLKDDQIDLVCHSLTSIYKQDLSANFESEVQHKQVCL